MFKRILNLVPDKLKSRKLWMAIGMSALLTLKNELGLEIDDQTALAIGGIGASYIIGQGWADGKRGEGDDS